MRISVRGGDDGERTSAFSRVRHVGRKFFSSSSRSSKVVLAARTRKHSKGGWVGGWVRACVCMQVCVHVRE